MPNHTDLNGDGRDDLIVNSTVPPPELMYFFEWAGQPDGSFGSIWFDVILNGQTTQDSLCTGDFNGDGTDDLFNRYAPLPFEETRVLFHTPHGIDWELSATRYHLDSTWHVAGVGDFDGDGCDDLLLRHDDNIVTQWLGRKDGSFFSNHAIATYVLPAGWHVVGTGDFNGDSRSDILLENDQRIVTEWQGQSDGSFFSNHVVATSVLPAGWHVAGTGDFNGDRRDDVLLIHDDGTVTEWLGRADGSFFSNHAIATYVLPSDWSVKGTGDYNGDGFDDVLLQQDIGIVTNWLGQENGTFFSNHLASSLTTNLQIRVNDFGNWI